MKKIFFLAALALTVMSCTNNASEFLTPEAAQPDPTTVTLTFTPYEMEAMTRAGVECSSVLPTRKRAATRAAVADFANKLDLWLFDGDTPLQSVQQESTQPGFATLSLTLDKRKTYTLIAVAHKSSAGHATLQDGIISWPNDKISQTFFYTHTFTPADVTTLDCQMQRIVGQFRLETTDPLPADAATATIAVAETFTRWSTTVNSGTAPANRTVTFSTLSTTADGTLSLSAYVISTADAPTPHAITVTFLTADGQPLQQRTFPDVPIRNGYRTTYRGQFFTDAPFTSTFTVDDWQDYDVTEF